MTAPIARARQRRRPRVSVIIPTTAYDDYFRRAIYSLTEDGYDELEIVVVLDGDVASPPHWLINCGVTVITGSTGERRQGAAYAINCGIALSTGAYIARLDADDVSLPGRLLAQVQALEQDSGLVVVGTRAVLIDTTDVIIGTFDVSGWDKPSLTLRRKNPFVHSSLMFRRSALEAVGNYDPRCWRMQDYDLLLRLALQGSMAILPDRLVGYRVHPQQASLKMDGFPRLMWKISRRRHDLARRNGNSALSQTFLDMAYIAAQLLRYAGLRKPRYLAGEFSGT